MCGHGIIACTTALIEAGTNPVRGDAAIIGDDSPAGFVRAQATLRDDRVVEVTFENVPSFVYSESVDIDTSCGSFSVVVVFGGAFYALVDASVIGCPVAPDQVRALIDFGTAV